MTPFPAQITRRIAVGAAFWTLSITFFVVQAVAQAASARPYSLTGNLISDLGNTACGATICSPLHGLVDGAFIAVGLLHWFGAVLTSRAWPPRNRSKVGVLCLCLAGWGLAYAGVFPENVAPQLHGFGAILGLMSLNAGMLVLGQVLLKVAKALGVLALLSGATGLVSLALFLGQASGLPRGICERLADYPGAAMIVVLGAFLLAHAARARGLPSTITA